MNITNDHNLPEPLVAAVQNDPYDRGDADITVTELIDSAQIRGLKNQWAESLTEDVSMRIWSLIGQSVHGILHRAEENLRADYQSVREVRFTAPFSFKHDGIRHEYTISGTPDRCLLNADAGVLQDYKTASTWEYIYGLKPDREAQLNIYAWLLEQNHMPRIETLEAIMIFKDWSPGQIGRRNDYPDRPVYAIEVPRWSNLDTWQYLKDRLIAHFITHPHCTPEERWEKPGQWVIRKEGRKTAVRRLDSSKEAWTYALDKGIAEHDDKGRMSLTKGYSIEPEPAEQRRCETNASGHSYCPVSAFCPQWGLINEGSTEAAE